MACTCSNWTFCRNLPDCRWPRPTRKRAKERAAMLRGEHSPTIDCWCRPVLDHRASEPGIAVWVHNDTVKQ